MRFLFVAIALAVTTAGPATAQPDAASPSAPPSELGPELWDGARVGMGQEDIVRRFPAAVATPGELLPSGAKSALVLATPFGGGPARLQFYFDAQGGLAEVIADRGDVGAHHTDDNLAKARALGDRLAARYGKPGECAEQRSIASLTCTWVIGETKTILSYRDVAGATPSLSVSFRKRQDTPPWTPRAVRRLKPR